MSVTRTRIERLERWIPTPVPRLFHGMALLDALLLAMQDFSIADEVLGYAALLNEPGDGRDVQERERRVVARVSQIIDDTVVRAGRGELVVPEYALFRSRVPRRVAGARLPVPHGARP